MCAWAERQAGNANVAMSSRRIEPFDRPELRGRFISTPDEELSDAIADSHGHIPERSEHRPFPQGDRELRERYLAAKCRQSRLETFDLGLHARELALDGDHVLCRARSIEELPQPVAACTERAEACFHI